jgi:hypothetical protein
MSLVPVAIKFNSLFNLTGLIEGEGSIIIPAPIIKYYRPYFEIIFRIDDLI